MKDAFAHVYYWHVNATECRINLTICTRYYCANTERIIL